MTEPSSSPQERAVEKFIFLIIGLAVLFLAPLGTTVLGVLIARSLGAVDVGVAFIGIAAFFLGVAFPILAIDYLSAGQQSVLSKTYTRLLDAELSADKRESTNNAKELKEAKDSYVQLAEDFNKMKEQYDKLQLEVKGDSFQLGKWK